MIHKSKYNTQDIPSKPGVYVFRDRLGKVIYVGKAKNLRRRFSSYFQPSRARTADPKLRSLINSIEFYELHTVRTEEEAMLLESRLIKQYNPRYNVVFRDDKRFLLIKIDIHEPYPRLSLARLRKDDGCLYFGPFPQLGALRDTVDYLTRHFNLRSCTAREPGERERRHCLDKTVRDCSAPCEERISREDYLAKVQQMIRVFEGDIGELVDDLEAKMTEYAERQNFEMAARLRDVRRNVEEVFGARNRNFAHTSLAQSPGPKAVAELQNVLDLPRAPVAIECFDNSNIMGSFAVASMVRFVDGAPSRKDYRHYRIREVEGIDDFAMMREIVTRRYRRLRDEEKPLPDLVVVDGGRGQLSMAWQALHALGLDNLPVISLAKRHEEVFTLYEEEPVVLDRHSTGLRLLQALRDEAHRFAVTFHRDLRRKRILNSLLDEIPGVGDVRKQQLLKQFGSVRNLRRYDAEEIVRRCPGIGPKLAAVIAQHISRDPAPADE